VLFFASCAPAASARIRSRSSCSAAVLLGEIFVLLANYDLLGRFRIFRRFDFGGCRVDCLVSGIEGGLGISPRGDHGVVCALGGLVCVGGEPGGLIG
jgi:hypothetical protein